MKLVICAIMYVLLYAGDSITTNERNGMKLR